VKIFKQSLKFELCKFANKRLAKNLKKCFENIKLLKQNIEEQSKRRLKDS